MPERNRASLCPPAPPDFVNLAAEWCENQSALLLGYVWQAYDSLYGALQSAMPPAVDRGDLERSLTQLLEPRIHQVMTGDEPFYIQHGPYERETKMPAPAQPPQYDLAFVLYVDERIMWPLEAKVLRNAKGVKAYVADVNEQFLSCRYAPFSSGAAMLGYLLSGDPHIAFSSIAARVPCTLKPHDFFKKRPHCVSRHIRTSPPGKSYVRRFTCHHLLLQFPSLSPEQELPLN